MNPDDFVQSANQVNAPSQGRPFVFWIVLVLVVLVLIGGGVWFFFFRGGADLDLGSQEDEPIVPVVSDTEFAGPTEVFTEDPIPNDRDRDGLTTEEEATYGTDDFEYDTDGDGLSDFDEIYDSQTDPTNPDTDGDTFWDGLEISNGFNPLGEG